jgi:hypothetical protein
MSENTNELRAIWSGSRFVDIEDISILTNPNQQLANAIATGPQDEFYELLNQTNQSMDRYYTMNYYGYTNYRNIDDGSSAYHIGVTPTWRWKPKTKDKVQKVASRILGLNKKSNGIDKYLGRISDMARYRLHHLVDKFQKLENLKRTLKREGYSANVDIEEYKVKLIDFSDRIKNECDKINEFSNGNISVSAEPFINIPINERETSFYLILTLTGLKMNIYQENTLLQEFSMYPIHIVFNSKLRKMMKYLDTPVMRNADVYFTGLYDSPEMKIDSRKISHITEHPYIATPRWNNELQMYKYGTVCLDKYMDEIRTSFHKLDYVSMLLSILSWAQYYNTNYANPYNQPTMLHLGMPESLNKSYQILYVDSIGTTSCSRRMRLKYKLQNIHHLYDKFHISSVKKIHEKECDAMKCVWREKCEFYLANNRMLERLADDTFRYMLESVIGWFDEKINNNLLLDEQFDDYFNVPYNHFDNFEDIINCIIMNDVAHLDSFLSNNEYWGEEIIPIDRDAISDEDMKSLMLRWATERRL